MSGIRATRMERNMSTTGGHDPKPNALDRSMRPLPPVTNQAVREFKKALVEQADVRRRMQSNNGLSLREREQLTLRFVRAGDAYEETLDSLIEALLAGDL